MTGGGSSDRTADRFFTVSLNDDASRLSAPLWEGRFSPDAVQNLHLDLRAHAPNASMVAPEQLIQARAAAFEFIRGKGLTSSTHHIDLVLRCKVALAIWLGYEMRFSRKIRAFKYYAGDLVPFSQPREVECVGRADLQRLEIEPPLRAGSTTASGDAVLLVDLVGKATDAQLDRFFPREGAPAVRTRHAYRLTLAAGTVVQPEDLEPILVDVIETLGALRARGAGRVHLGFAGPDVLAFFLGQQLRAQGLSIHLYEFYSMEGGTYRLAFPLEAQDPSAGAVRGAPASSKSVAAQPHFLDEVPLRFDRSEVQDLLTLLCNHVTVPADVVRLLKAAGVSTNLIVVNQAVGHLWLDVLERASAQEKLRELLGVIQRDSEYRRLAGHLRTLLESSS